MIDFGKIGQYSLGMIDFGKIGHYVRNDGCPKKDLDKIGTLQSWNNKLRQKMDTTVRSCEVRDDADSRQDEK